MSGPGEKRPRPRCVVGNPDNRRVALYQAALAKLGEPPAKVIAYRDLLTEPLRAVAFPEGSLVRIESPGEDFEVERRLIAWGADHPELGAAERVSAEDAVQLPFERGRLRLLRQWYLGYRVLLERIEEMATDAGASFVNSPADIALMFDKPRCQAHLAQHDVPTPPRLRDMGNYRHLREAAKVCGLSRVFVKPAHSSSAAGVVAIHFQEDSVRAFTTVEVERGDETRYFNNLQLQTIQEERELEALIDFLFAEGAHAERWMPKAILHGANFDLRVVVIAGQPQHTVVRSSKGPLTNLHLGNRRGDVEALRMKMGARWDEVLSVAARAALAFPNSLYVGIDLLLQPGFRRPAVLEANAFGDLLPGVRYDGRETYEAELLAEPLKLKDDRRPQ